MWSKQLSIRDILKPHLRNIYNRRSGKIYSLVHPEDERKHRGTTQKDLDNHQSVCVAFLKALERRVEQLGLQSAAPDLLSDRLLAVSCSNPPILKEKLKRHK